MCVPDFLKAFYFFTIIKCFFSIQHYRHFGADNSLFLETVLYIVELACMLRCFSRIRLFMTLWTVSCQAPLSMGFSRQEYWMGLPCTLPRNIPDPGIEFAFPALQADSLPLSHWGSLCYGTFSSISGLYTKQQKYCLSGIQKCP